MSQKKSSNYSQAISMVFNSLRKKSDVELQSLMESYSQHELTKLLMGYANANEQGSTVEAVAISFTSPSYKDIDNVIFASSTSAQLSIQLHQTPNSVFGNNIVADGNIIWTLAA